MIAPDSHCKAATVGRTGRTFREGTDGFFKVEDRRDVAEMRAHGFVQAGSTPRTSRVWVCECGWEALINHCPRCDRSDLERRA